MAGIYSSETGNKKNTNVLYYNSLEEKYKLLVTETKPGYNTPVNLLFESDIWLHDRTVVKNHSKLELPDTIEQANIYDFIISLLNDDYQKKMNLLNDIEDL